ncbi:MAG: HAD family hydrolase [Bacteroidales bacterium]|nr:HAD family hydrolase [Bacteroidales bacterium]
MIKNILFDFDGTLADTAQGIVTTLRQSFIQMGRPVPTEEAMVATIGVPLWKAFQTLGNMTDEEASQAVEIYRRLFMEYEIPNIRMFPGVAEMLEQLRERGIRMAIVTSRDRLSLDLILQNNGIDKSFETVVTVNDQLTPKPAPDMVLALLERMDIKATETLVVGDTTFDIQMGNRAGCKTCAVTWGNHSHELLLSACPNMIIDDLDSLYHELS